MTSSASEAKRSTDANTSALPGPTADASASVPVLNAATCHVATSSSAAPPSMTAVRSRERPRSSPSATPRPAPAIVQRRCPR
ncbi:MAG: hypothetical protein U0325_13810 [Polyangiales bacterium]